MPATFSAVVNRQSVFGWRRATATGLTVHNLTGDEVLVALSSINHLSLAGLVREKHATLLLLIAADRDLNGGGHTKARRAVEACNTTVTLPPVFGDWNDAFMQYGEESTRRALTEADGSRHAARRQPV